MRGCLILLGEIMAGKKDDIALDGFFSFISVPVILMLGVILFFLRFWSSTFDCLNDDYLSLFFPLFELDS